MSKSQVEVTISGHFVLFYFILFYFIIFLFFYVWKESLQVKINQ